MPGIPALKEVEAEGREVQGHAQLHNGLETGLGYLRKLGGREWRSQGTN